MLQLKKTAFISIVSKAKSPVSTLYTTLLRPRLYNPNVLKLEEVAELVYPDISCLLGEASCEEWYSAFNKKRPTRNSLSSDHLHLTLIDYKLLLNND